MLTEFAKNQLELAKLAAETEYWRQRSSDEALQRRGLPLDPYIPPITSSLASVQRLMTMPLSDVFAEDDSSDRNETNLFVLIYFLML